MNLRDKPVWEALYLSQPHHDFDIALSRGFAKKMINISLTQKEQRQMNIRGAELLDRLGYTGSSPYQFHKDTAFVRHINLDGGRGTWLELEGQYGKTPDFSIEKPLTYTTHNMDCSSDTLGLLSLFEQWIYYSDVLKS